MHIAKHDDIISDYRYKKKKNFIPAKKKIFIEFFIQKDAVVSVRIYYVQNRFHTIYNK